VLIRSDLSNLGTKVDELQKEQKDLRQGFHKAEIKAAQDTISRATVEALQAEVARLNLKIATVEAEARVRMAVLGAGISIVVSAITSVIARMMFAG